MKQQDNQRIPGFWRHFLALLLSGLFSQIYPIISTALISHRLDIAALSSVGALSPVSVLQSALFAGLGTGISLHLSITLNDPGRNRGVSALRGSLLILILTFAAGILLSAVSGQLCLLLHIPESLHTDSSRYLAVLLAGSGLLTLKTALLQIHQNTGKIRFASIVSMAGVLLQSCLAILLFLIFPGQIWYVPASILLTNLILSLLLLVVLYLRFRPPVRRGEEMPGHVATAQPEKTDRIPENIFTAARQIARLGLSRSGLMILIGIGGFFLQRSINGLPEDTIAGYSCGNVAVNLFMEPLNTAAVLMTVFLTGEKSDREIGNAISIEKQLLKKALPYCLILLVLLPLAGRKLLSLLSSSDVSSAVVNAGYLRLLITLPLFFPLVIYLVSRNVLQLLSPGTLYLLGLLEFLWEMIGAFWIPYIGYSAAPISIACAWFTGAVVCMIILSRMKRKAKRVNNRTASP